MAVLKTEPSRRIGRTDSGNNGMQQTRARRIDLSLSNVLSLSAVSLSFSLSLSLFLSLFLSLPLCLFSKLLKKNRVPNAEWFTDGSKLQQSSDLTSPRVLPFQPGLGHFCSDKCLKNYLNKRYPDSWRYLGRISQFIRATKSVYSRVISRDSGNVILAGSNTIWE